jgi:hypothetical protein
VTQLTLLEPTVEQDADVDPLPADLTGLSCLKQLQQLCLHFAPPVQPAAGLHGPFCLPGSLTSFSFYDTDYDTGFAGPWLTHLRGCPNLQELHLFYKHQEHASAHPSAVVELLADHHRQLRVLELCDCANVQWGLAVPGLPDADAPEGEGWRPTAALAALTGLQHLASNGLRITDQADWQHLAQLTALTGLELVQLC